MPVPVVKPPPPTKQLIPVASPTTFVATVPGSVASSSLTPEAVVAKHVVTPIPAVPQRSVSHPNRWASGNEIFPTDGDGPLPAVPVQTPSPASQPPPPLTATPNTKAVPPALSTYAHVMLMEEQVIGAANDRGNIDNGCDVTLCNVVINPVNFGDCSAFLQAYMFDIGGRNFGYLESGPGRGRMHVLHHLVHSMRSPYFDITYEDFIEAVSLLHFQFHHVNCRTDGSYAGFNLPMLLRLAKHGGRPCPHTTLCRPCPPLPPPPPP